LTTKILALVDALGNLARFILMPGQRHDSVGVEPLISDVAFDALLADKAFDNNWLRAELNDRSAIAVIPPKATRKEAIDCDFEMHKWRHLIENLFCKPKEFRTIATRYEKNDESYTAMIHLVGAAIAVRRMSTDPNSAVVQTLEVEPIRGPEVTAGHAARTAFQISGAVLSLMHQAASSRHGNRNECGEKRSCSDLPVPSWGHSVGCS
jgi:transposase